MNLPSLKMVFRTWPIKMLGLVLAIAAVLLVCEILAVLLNLPEKSRPLQIFRAFILSWNSLQSRQPLNSSNQEARLDKQGPQDCCHT
jgi:hypothetical protein